MCSSIVPPEFRTRHWLRSFHRGTAEAHQCVGTPPPPPGTRCGICQPGPLVCRYLDVLRIVQRRLTPGPRASKQHVQRILERRRAHGGPGGDWIVLGVLGSMPTRCPAARHASCRPRLCSRFAEFHWCCCCCSLPLLWFIRFCGSWCPCAAGAR